MLVDVVPKGAGIAEGAGGFGRRPGWAIVNEESYFLPYCEAVMADLRIRMRSIQVSSSRKYKDIFSNNDNNDYKYTYNDTKWPNYDGDTIKDGTEDANHNGKIDGDNGDGIYQSTEYFTETDPNEHDTDQDSILDNIEKQYGYNPLSDDTDMDGLNDTEEDLNKDGHLDAGETDPTNKDSDGDGLTDLMEKTGWTIVVRYESTGEEKERYDITSNPRKIHSDNDQVSDLDEYKNATDPNKIDTDGDGKSDYEELNCDYGSSATGVDGEPPNIWDFDVWYDTSYKKFLGIKLPNGVKLGMKVGVSDIFGLDYLQISIKGLEDKKASLGGVENTTVEFDWEINGWDNIKRAVWDGFKINITARDINGNLGYRDEEQPGIAKLVLSALLGALLAAVKFITELASGIFNWILDFANVILEIALIPITLLINTIVSTISGIFEPMTENYDDSVIVEKSKSYGLAKMFEYSGQELINVAKFIDPIMIILGALNVFMLALAILDAISSAIPIKALIAVLVALVLTLLLNVFGSAIAEEIGFGDLKIDELIYDIGSKFVDWAKEEWAIPILDAFAFVFDFIFRLTTPSAKLFGSDWSWALLSLFFAFLSLIIGDGGLRGFMLEIMTILMFLHKSP